MQVQLFKPNSKSTGAAAKFQISQKAGMEPLFFINAIQQFSWDEAARTGSFKENQKDPKKNIALKFNELELGEMIHTFKTGLPYSTFHKGKNSNTGISLIPYDRLINQGKKTEATVKNFGYTFIRDGSDIFKLSVAPGEAIRLSALFYKFFDVLDSYRQEKFGLLKFGVEKAQTKQEEVEEPTEEEVNQEDPEDDGAGF